MSGEGVELCATCGDEYVDTPGDCRWCRVATLRDAVVDAARAWSAGDTLANNAALRAAVDALVTEERKP